MLFKYYGRILNYFIIRLTLYIGFLIFQLIPTNINITIKKLSYKMEPSLVGQNTGGRCIQFESND